MLLASRLHLAGPSLRAHCEFRASSRPCSGAPYQINKHAFAISFITRPSNVRWRECTSMLCDINCGLKWKMKYSSSVKGQTHLRVYILSHSMFPFETSFLTKMNWEKNIKLTLFQKHIFHVDEKNYEILLTLFILRVERSIKK